MIEFVWLNAKQAFFVLKIMKQKEPKDKETEPQDTNPTLEDLRAELGLYDDEPSDETSGWDLGKEELF